MQEVLPESRPRSREKVSTAGLYLAAGHYHEGFRLELLLQAGDSLPGCPDCDAEITWEYIGSYGEAVIDGESILLTAGAPGDLDSPEGGSGSSAGFG